VRVESVIVEREREREKGQCGPAWRPRKGQATEGGRRGAGELLNRALTQLCSRPATGSGRCLLAS